MENSDNQVNLRLIRKQDFTMNDELDFDETLRKMAEYAKQLDLLNMIRKILQFIRENQNMYFADLLRALARYTAVEYVKDEMSNPDWDVIGHLLEMAASKIEVERVGMRDRSVSIEVDIEEQFANYHRHSLLSS